MDIQKEYKEKDIFYSLHLYSPSKEEIDDLMRVDRRLNRKALETSYVLVIHHNYTGKERKEILALDTTVARRELEALLTPLEKSELFEYCAVVRDVLIDLNVCELTENLFQEL